MKKALVFFAVIPLLLFIGLRKNSAPFFSVKTYQCVQDGKLSDNHFSVINTEVAYLLDNNFSASLMIDHLKQKFPVLKKIVIAYRPAVVGVTLFTYEPVCCINNTTVLIEHNQLLSHDIFSAQTCNEIPHVMVMQDIKPETPLLVSSLLQRLPCNVNSTYNLELLNEYYVRFVDKEKQNFTIVSSVEQEKSPRLFTQCESVKQVICERGGFDKGVKWIADTRFAHYIVAYRA